jgi:hypothetical protein
VTTPPDRQAILDVLCARASTIFQTAISGQRPTRARASVYDRTRDAERSSVDVVRKGLVKSVSVEVTA